jgi:3-hydroxyisobutyrate dehydrogenase-like beta-hydroxyacid dehydrogenase
MGAAVGVALVQRGCTVRWASEGRSAATRERAEAAGLEAVDDVRTLAGASDVVFSVCPPGAALDVADRVAAERFDGLYVDLNAIAPATAMQIERRFHRFVDGGIVGGPPSARGDTRLFLSGTHARDVVALFDGTRFETVELGDEPGAASAVKAAYAAWTKGSAALLLAVRALARRHDVEDALLDEWDRSQPGLAARSDAVARANTRKAWRFVGEMDEQADAFAGVGLPDGFSRAAADVYRRLAQTGDAADL